MSPRWSVTISIASALFVTAPASTAAPSPLADAAERANWQSVQELLEAKSGVAAAQVDGTTALHWAAYHDDLASVKALLEAGADAKATNQFGVPPLHLACVNGNDAIVKALLDAGADANTTLRGGETALMTAARTGRPDAVRELLDRGAKVNATDRKGQTALMWAAADGQVAVVEQLLKAGADRYTKLKSGFTAFLFAAREGRIEVVRSLLKAGADANEAIEPEKAAKGRAPEEGTSALMLALENGHFELAMELVNAGANLNDQRTGFTPLHALSWVRRPNRGDDLAGQPPPQGSGRLTSLEFARELVKAGADVNRRLDKRAGRQATLSLDGATPFFLFSRTADLPMMKLLVELGADPLLPNKDGATPLMAAAGLGCKAPDEEAGAEQECIEAVEYLLTLRANVNSVDKNGETAMHGAAYKSLPHMVQFLADHGLKVDSWNHKNKSGWTPILIAEGFRPGNFKPSFETLEALRKVMLAVGISPPPPTPRMTSEPKGYHRDSSGVVPSRRKNK